MTIEEIYIKHNIPPNLQAHMLSVAKVAVFIWDHWNGKQLDRNIVLKAALLHDLGNIVRFDFKNHPEFFGDEANNIDHWIQVQADTIKKYGNDDHETTKSMLTELNVDDNITDVILSKSFGNSVKIYEGDNWYYKLLLYSDMRVAPQGIVSLQIRLEDIRKRAVQYRNRPDFVDLIEACYGIEKQIQNNINASLRDIAPELLYEDSQVLLSTRV